ncbi:MAG: GtrA family protein [Lachnospiraceae bacterium]|nr:GtrA family protein [Lachnospiraceae bacterium]
MHNSVKKIWILIESGMRKVLKVIFGLIGKDCTDKSYETMIQFVRFGIVGLSNNVIFYIFYVICLLLFRKLHILQDKGYLVAQVIAFIISMLWSFYWNNKVVFILQESEKRSKFKVLVKMSISYSFTGLFLNSILLVLWVNVLSVSEFIAPIINLFVCVPINFVINKLWAFKTHIELLRKNAKEF